MDRFMLGILCLREVVSVGAFAVPSVFANSTTSTTDDATASQLNGPKTTSSTGSGSATTGNVADYIMQGLSTTTIHSTMTIFETVTVKNDSWQACQSSWVSWSEEYSKTLSPTVYTTTHWETFYNTYNITSGIGDVYTTIDGIPHVRGNFTPTAVGTYTWTYSEPDVATSTITLDVNFTTPSPTCSISVAQCSKLWQSYLLSLGITTPLNEATEPAITPMPTNRPRCSIGNASWSHTAATWDNTCFISGDRVGLYYWPSATDEVMATPTPRANLTAAPVTAVVGNFTFTSPSVYLSFNTLYAIQGHDADQVSATQTVPLGASPLPETLVGGFYPEPVGPTLTNRIVSLNPTKLSSVIANLGPGVNTASAISEIAHGGPDYAKWISALKDSSPVPTANNSYLIRPVNFASLTLPGTDDYYLQPSIAPGCFNPYGPHPACSTIFEGAYRAQLLVPQEVRTLRPEWAGCGIPLDGVYDPPSALQAASSEAKPQPPSPAPAVSKSAVITPSPTTAAISKSEDPKPQPTVSDPLPVNTATPSPQPEPIQQTSAEESVSKDPDPQLTQGTRTAEHTSEAIPLPDSVSEPHSSGGVNTIIASPSLQSNDPGLPTSLNNEPSVTIDPVQASPSADPPQDPSPVPSASSNGGSGPSQTAVVVVGSQTLSIPAPEPPAPVNTDPPVAPSGPTDALSVLAGAQSSEGQPAALAPTQPAPQTPSMAAVVDLPHSTIIVASPQQESDAITIGSATLSPGGPAATIDNHEVSAGSQGIVIDSQTLAYASYRVLDDPQSAQSASQTPTNAAQSGSQDTRMVAAFVTFGSSSMVVASPTGNDHAIVLGSTTLTLGGPAVTFGGHEVSAATNGIMVDSQMAAYSTMLVAEQTPTPMAGTTDLPSAPLAAEAAVTADGHTYSFYQASGSSAVVVDGQTLSVGSPATTISGQAISVGSNMVVVGSQTISFADSVLGTPSPSIVELGAGTYVYGSQTITAGGSVHTELGHSVTAVSSGLVIDGTTLHADATKTSGAPRSSSSQSSSSHATTTSPITSTSRDSATTSTADMASVTTSRSTASGISMMLESCLAAMLTMTTITLALYIM